MDFALEAYAVVHRDVRDEADGARVSMATPAGVVAADIAVTGVHNVRNALAATACALAIGVAPRAIGAGLEAFGRSADAAPACVPVRRAALIDDTYNANPDSVRAAIDLLAAAVIRACSCFGDMGEVGDRGPEFHREIGSTPAPGRSTPSMRPLPDAGSRRGLRRRDSLQTMSMR